ncbi:uncharacterized protein [Physcomitrium patens]|uniref:Exostosin GT47 domain-containing protein n=1 Tax=Physcomitrium patens TaxID=3218 RepID=A0A2K1KNR1_PHYPA|nr:hypothetical protein PHYPA_006321 [Physcomitrium patens]
MKRVVCRLELILFLCFVVIFVSLTSFNSAKFLKHYNSIVSVSRDPGTKLLESTPANCNCTDRAVCPPAETVVVEKEIIKEVVKKEECRNNGGPWYAEGKTWHYPARFPLCSMDVCFNYTKCDSSENLLIFTYNLPSPPKRYFSRINESKYYTNDPAKACLFLVFLDGDTPWPPHPSTLPYWNGGQNHVLVIFADKWHQKGPHQASIGNASVMASDTHETTYRPGFDVSVPLPGRLHVREFQSLKPLERKYLATFRGLRYLGLKGEGVFRSLDAFRGMHNGNDVIVATSCEHAISKMIREKEPALGVHCDEDLLIHKNFTFHDLMNTTFGLVPAGVQPASYRFIEVLSAGAIPVLIADNYVKPFDTLILWYKCLLQFPTTEMHRIVGTLRAMKPEEIQTRQENCLAIYNKYLKDDETLLQTSIQALKIRFLGTIPGFTDITRKR